MKYWALKQKDGSFFSEWLCNLIEVCCMDEESALAFDNRQEAQTLADQINKAKGVQKYTVVNITNAVVVTL